MAAAPVASSIAGAGGADGDGWAWRCVANANEQPGGGRPCSTHWLACRSFKSDSVVPPAVRLLQLEVNFGGAAWKWLQSVLSSLAG